MVSDVEHLFWLLLQFWGALESAVLTVGATLGMVGYLSYLYHPKLLNWLREPPDIPTEEQLVRISTPHTFRILLSQERQQSSHIDYNLLLTLTTSFPKPYLSD